MYKQVETHKTARLKNCMNVAPVATLKDGYGHVMHVWAMHDTYFAGTGDVGLGSIEMTAHIPPALLKILKSLPDLKG